MDAIAELRAERDAWRARAAAFAVESANLLCGLLVARGIHARVWTTARQDPRVYLPGHAGFFSLDGQGVVYTVIGNTPTFFPGNLWRGQKATVQAARDEYAAGWAARLDALVGAD